MLGSGDSALGELADVVLHESLHATFYVPGQSTLNESMASFVGDRLAVQFLEETQGEVPRKRFLDGEQKRIERGKKMKAAYEALEKLYASSAPVAAKLAEKRRIVDALRAELRLARPVTNATLIQYKTYGSGREEMEQLLDRCHGDFPRMLRALERVRPLAKRARPHTDPGQLLKPLLDQECE